MGEKIEIKAVEIIYQKDRTLLQIDFCKEGESWQRAFIEVKDFLKMIKW